MITPDENGFIKIRVGKDGVIKGILTTDTKSTEANPIPGTFADVDQFQYITTQSSQKGATKYKKPEDISGGGSVLMFPDGSIINIKAEGLSDAEVKEAIKQGAKKQ